MSPTKKWNKTHQKPIIRETRIGISGIHFARRKRDVSPILEGTDNSEWKEVAYGKEVSRKKDDKGLFVDK